MKRPPRIRKVPSDIPGRASGRNTATGGRATPGGMFPSPGAGAPRPAGPTGSLSVPVPWSIRPPSAREINVDASGTGYTNANTPATIAGSAFTIPPDNVGILRSVVLSVNTMLTTSALTWTLRFNGVPVDGWSQLTIFPRNAGSVSIAFGPTETFIPVPEGTTIDVQIGVGAADANTYQAGVTYHGWSYPKRLADIFANLYQF
jgi:hypothetical protein